jgi:hypothetical protein
MDMRDYIGGAFLRPEDIGDGTIIHTIVAVAPNKYDKLDLTFEDGSKIGLNATNGRILAKAWGWDSDALIDKQVELSVGTVPYDGKDVESIKLRPVTVATPVNERVIPKRPDPDEDIPF